MYLIIHAKLFISKIWSYVLTYLCLCYKHQISTLHIIYKLDGDTAVADGDTAVGDGVAIIVKNIFDDCDDREMLDDNTAVGSSDILDSTLVVTVVGSRVNSSY